MSNFSCSGRGLLNVSIRIRIVVVCAGLEERILPYEDGLEKRDLRKKHLRRMDDEKLSA